MIVSIEKIENIPVPVMLKIKFEDNSTMVVKQTARAWEAGNKTYKVQVGGEKKIRLAALDGRRVPDFDKSNNLFLVK